MCEPGLMNLSLDTTVALHGTVHIPLLGFGTFKVRNGQDVEQAVATALDLGYRHIDTAVIYRNEEGVGRAIAASGIDRSEIFVTTKVWNSDQGYGATLAAIDASLERLGMDYVDLYLVHWPKPAHTLETWRAMEEIQESGKAQAIGVSNYLTHHLGQLLENATVLPSINQIQFHPHLQSPDLVDYCDDRGIVIEAWGPPKAGSNHRRSGAGGYCCHPWSDRAAGRVAVDAPARRRRHPQERDHVPDRGERRSLRLRALLR